MSIPLNFANTGEFVEIKEVCGGDILFKKLTAMGIIKGCRIQIMRNDAGPIIIKKGASRLVIGRGMAQKIMVGKL